MQRLLDRIAIQREVTAKVKAKASAGKDKKTIRAEVRAEMEQKYGANVDWKGVLDFIMKVLELLLKVL